MNEKDELIRRERELEDIKDEILVNATVSHSFSSWFNALDILNEMDFEQVKIRCRIKELDEKELEKYDVDKK